VRFCSTEEPEDEDETDETTDALIAAQP
jgi:hypothetical protein